MCSTDKVQGLKGVGDKTADKYFESFCDELGWGKYNNLETKALSLYLEKEPLKKAISHFSECFNLVYLLTTPEEVKSITGQDFEFIEPYYFSNVNPNIFGNFTKPEDDSDLPDFLK
jgi:5'-3' exonuclease